MDRACEACRCHTSVIDLHHWTHQTPSEISYLCPNCHAIYERLIRLDAGGLVGGKNLRFQEFSKENTKEKYLKLIRKIIKRSKIGNKNKKGLLACQVCGYSIVIDMHHYASYQYGTATIYLCPSHHAILHRILKDKGGEKEQYTSKEKVIRAIKEMGYISFDKH